MTPEKAQEIETKLPHTWQGVTIDLAVKTSEAAGNKPGFVWLGGFKSDMAGTKAEKMVEQAQTLGCSSLRFDYSGHGVSGGEFVDGSISRWVDETVTVLREKTFGPQIIVGSSMGGWIALRLAQELGKIGETDRLAALLLIAPAPDFTETLMEPAFSEAQKEALETVGYFEEPTEYSDEPNIITRKLIEDGRQNSLLNDDLAVGCPVHILQGKKDPDVPFAHAFKLAEALPHDDVVMTLVKDGDHRLSRDQDIELLQRTMANLLEQVTA